MTVRSKYRVQSIERQQHWSDKSKEVQTIKLGVVTDGSEENKSFYAATPSGSITLGTVNAEAARQFELGADFYVDFTRANE